MPPTGLLAPGYGNPVTALLDVIKHSGFDYHLGTFLGQE